MHVLLSIKTFWSVGPFKPTWTDRISLWSPSSSLAVSRLIHTYSNLSLLKEVWSLIKFILKNLGTVRAGCSFKVCVVWFIRSGRRRHIFVYNPSFSQEVSDRYGYFLKCIRKLSAKWIDLSHYQFSYKVFNAKVRVISKICIISFLNVLFSRVSREQADLPSKFCFRFIRIQLTHSLCFEVFSRWAHEINMSGIILLHTKNCGQC